MKSMKNLNKCSEKKCGHIVSQKEIRANELKFEPKRSKCLKMKGYEHVPCLKKLNSTKEMNEYLKKLNKRDTCIKKKCM